MEREQIAKRLRAQLHKSGRIIGVAAGNGAVAKYAIQGGADLLLALTSGRFRQMGRSSLAGLLPFTNGNELVMQFGTQEIISLRDAAVPVIFGLCASDPTIELDRYTDRIRDSGFSGIANYPSIGVVDGKFREALEERGLGYGKEVEAIRAAHRKNLFTIAFVFDELQAERMAAAGADVICANLGLTKGGELGAKKVLSLEAGVRLANRIFEHSDRVNPSAIKMLTGGPISTPIDLHYMYDNTPAVGYVGGSSLERIPSEQFITDRIIAFKATGVSSKDKLLQKMLDGVQKHYDYVEFIKEYVAENFMNEISFHELAMVAHVSRSYLSTLFKKDVGCNFPEYLAKYRIGKAIEIMKREELSLLEISSLVGFKDYAPFSRTFKKVTGVPPKAYARELRGLAASEA
ncbi:phosphoenolpyruvate hydrolase family protein [Paenibacillus arenilitoris]|uniref:Phosphoenolpyruvate hydrolase family protein n=1 Tax=Paenibacillus arenilitoris TaxID=2772299 RepID=A0A927CRJ1_9BACL|nr:phosphoenolpyruvate hydrolase family protein [Paenibacillus arenilitoris]MBD2872834.1 phosphoenolpyruvate hydrolase family protein [Paenibacillus arenilitoris]